MADLIRSTLKVTALPICLLAGAALLLAVPARAQWSGSVDLSGGLGGIEGGLASDYKPVFHGLAQGEFRLNYKTDKFSWNTTLNGKWEPNTTDNTRISYKKERLGIIYKSASTRPLTVSLKSEFAWKPAADRNYSSWILYQYKNDRGQNHSLNYDGKENDSEKLSYNYEVPVLNEHKVETGLKTYRSFDSGRSILQSSLTFQAINSKKVTTWIVFKSENNKEGSGTAIDVDDLKGYAWKYRITPNSLDLNLDGDIHLQRTVLDDATKLKYAPGFRFSSKHALDENSGATRINVTLEDVEEAWRDSTRLRESFNYLSILAEPYLTADFKWNKLEAHLDYACQLYARRLNDETHRQPLKIKGVYPVGKSNIKWTISPRHSLNLTNQLSVAHPDYLKICWYDRTAGYLDQLYRGNEQLLSPFTQRSGLEYELTLNRFSARTSVTYTHVSNEIDQTWTNEEIDGRQYKVFHWMNSSNSDALGITQKLGWKGKVITANVAITYNQTRRASTRTDAVKNSIDWRLNADITARLGRGWSIGSDLKYQSKMKTFYTVLSEYGELNAQIQKDFKKFSLYLRGRHLLDQTVTTSFESEELQEYWVEEVRNNRRIVMIGVKWKF